MSSAIGTTPGTAGRSDGGWPREFKWGALIVLAASGVVALLASLLPAMMPRARQGIAPAVAEREWLGKRFVPRIVASHSAVPGADTTSRLPILIYRVTDVDATVFWLRPEGGGMLRSAAPEELISVSDAATYYNSLIAEDARNAVPLTVRATLRAHLGDEDGALSDCDEAILRDPQRPWAYYYRGLVRLHRREADLALADLDRAIQIDGGQARPHWARGRALAIKNEHDRAVAEFSEAIRLDPKIAAAYRDRATAWLALKDMAEGISDIAEAIRLDPEDSLSYCVRGELRAANQEWVLAIEDFDAALEQNPYAARAYFARGHCRLKLRQHEKGAKDLHQAVLLDSDVAYLDPSQGVDWDGKTTPEQAIVDFTELIRLDPRFSLAYTMRAHAYTRLGNVDRAIQDWNRSIQVDPRNALAYFRRGTECLRMSRFDQAVQDLSRAMHLDPKHAPIFKPGLVDALESRGWASVARKQYGSADADFAEEIRLDSSRAPLDPHRRDARYQQGPHAVVVRELTRSLRRVPDLARDLNRGLSRYERAEYAAAVEDFTALVRRLPDRAEVYCLRGRARYWTGAYDDAIADLSEAIRLDPGHLLAYSYCGHAHREKNEFDRAVDNYGEVIRRDPNDDVAYYNRGQMLRRMGEYEQAIWDFNESIRIDPTDPDPLCERGTARALLGRQDGAIGDFNEAIRVDPRSSLAYGNRAAAWQSRREFEKAFRDYDEAIRLDPGDLSMCFHRALLSYLTGCRGAVEEWRALIARQHRESPSSAYTALLGYFAARQDKQQDVARWFLDEARARSNPGKWPYPLVEHLRDGADESALSRSANGPIELAELHCFLGLERLHEGRNGDAMAHFLWVKEHSNLHAAEYAIASFELEQLGRGTPGHELGPG